MENPFISVRPKAPDRRPAVRVPIKRGGEEPSHHPVVAWVVAFLLLLAGLVAMWRTLRRAPGPGRSLQPEPPMAYAARTEDVRLLVERATRVRPEIEYWALPEELEPEPEAVAAPVFDFARMQQAEALRRVGALYLLEGRRSLALLAFGRSVEINPHNWKLWENIGWWFLKGGDFPSARRAFETALRLGGYRGEGPTVLAAIYRREGRLQDALYLWDWSRREVRGEWPQADLNEGLARIEEGQDEPAIRYLSRYVERRPGDVPALRALAFAQSRAGQWMEARQTLRQALADAPSSSALQAEAAAVAAQNWLTVEAMEHLEALVDLTSAATAYAYLQMPAFDGFRKTEMGRKLQSVLMIESGTSVVSRAEVEALVSAEIAPRFDAP